MHKTSLLATGIATILIAIPAFGQEADLPKIAQGVSRKFEADIAKAKLDYLQAIQKAQREALKALEAQERKIVRSGDLDAANEVREFANQIEQATITRLLGPDLDKPITVLLSPSYNFTISATSNGVPIGSFKKGQKISIQYISGAWGYGGSMGKRVISPDNPTRSNAAAAAVVSPSGETRNIPPGTAKASYTFTVTENGVHAIRMTDRDRKNNRGSATYTVKSAN